ncbi:MAG: hypothetical protein V4581_08125 [Bacteroidota bacterium]
MGGWGFTKVDEKKYKRFPGVRFGLPKFASVILQKGKMPPFSPDGAGILPKYEADTGDSRNNDSLHALTFCYLYIL